MLLLPVWQLLHLPDLAREIDVHGMSMSEKHATGRGNCLDMQPNFAGGMRSGKMSMLSVNMGRL